MAWRAVTNPFDPVRVLSDDQVEHIHLSSLRLLASTGMRVLHADARAVLAAAGCEVDDVVVRFDPDLITEVVAQAPSQFTLRARNPARDLEIGGRHVVFGSIGGPAFASDVERVTPWNHFKPDGYAVFDTIWSWKPFDKWTLKAAILNIGASYAWTGGPGFAHSAAAKAGVKNMTETLAVEWAPYGIRVNGLVPGLFPHQDEAAHIKEGVPDRGRNEGARQPAGRVGRPRELGWAATFLCSPYASYVTGATLVCDGANWQRRAMLRERPALIGTGRLLLAGCGAG